MRSSMPLFGWPARIARTDPGGVRLPHPISNLRNFLFELRLKVRFFRQKRPARFRLREVSTIYCLLGWGTVS